MNAHPGSCFSQQRWFDTGSSSLVHYSDSVIVDNCGTLMPKDIESTFGVGLIFVLQTEALNALPFFGALELLLPVARRLFNRQPSLLILPVFDQALTAESTDCFNTSAPFSCVASSQHVLLFLYQGGYRASCLSFSSPSHTRKRKF